MLSSAFSTPSIGPVVSVAQWSKRNKAAWLPFRNSLSPKFSSTTKTLQTHGALQTTRLVVARCSHQQTQTHRGDSHVPPHHHSSTQTPQVREEEQTRSNKHPQDHQHVRHQEQVPSRRLQMATGSLRPHLVDRQVRLKSWSLGLPTVAAERTVQLVRQMFWKCWTTRHGVRVYAGALRSAEGVSCLRHERTMCIRRPMCSRRGHGVLTGSGMAAQNEGFS
jgi:hypothetical protein